MKNRGKIGKFSWIGDLAAMLLIFLVSQLIVAAFMGILGVPMPVVSDIDAVPADVYMAEQEALARWNAIFYPVTMAVPIVLMWLYSRLRGGRGSMRIRCSAAGLNPSVILVGVVWLLAAQILLEPFVAKLPQQETPGLGLGAWAYLTALVSAPVLEEILCRGVLFETLHRRLSVWWSILITALFFGVIHGELSTAIVATVAGVIFGVLYVRTNSIFASMIVHSINNAMAFTLVVVGKDKELLRDIIGNDFIYHIVYGVAALIFLVATIEAVVKLVKIGRAERQTAIASEEKEVATDESSDELPSLNGVEDINENR
jgi:membrane protease YdiL (CAAX protease family)